MRRKIILKELKDGLHLKSIKPWGGKKALKQTQARDKLKNKLIKKHPNDIKYFIRFNYKEFDYRTDIKIIKKIVLKKLKKYNVPILKQK